MICFLAPFTLLWEQPQPIELIVMCKYFKEITCTKSNNLFDRIDVEHVFHPLSRNNSNKSTFYLQSCAQFHMRQFYLHLFINWEKSTRIKYFEESTTGELDLCVIDKQVDFVERYRIHRHIFHMNPQEYKIQFHSNNE